MNRNLKLAAVTATAVAAMTLTACSAGEYDDGECRTEYVPMFFSTVDHHYHYGSPSGKLVPAAKVPTDARKVPGYKPYTPPKAVAPRAPIGKPGPAYKAPAPAPRAGKR